MSQTGTNTGTCRWCGSELERRTVELNGREWFVGYEPCTCSDARDYEIRKGVEEEQRRLTEANNRRQGVYDRAGVPRAYRDAEYDKRAEKVHDMVADGYSIVVTGSIGCGKTSVVSAAVMKLIDDGMDVRFLKDRELLGMLRDVYNGTASETSIMASLRSHDVLVIDDLGKEPPTDWVQSKLFAVIDSRYDDMKPVIVTTHYPPDELAKRLSGKGDSGTARSIVSRLMDRNRSVRIELSGGDRRVR